jgi:electron transport complex protein RnfG
VSDAPHRDDDPAAVSVPPDAPPTVARAALRAAGQLGLAALFATTLVAGTWALTRGPIADAERDARRHALEIVLPSARYDNDPDADAVHVHAPAWLGPDPTTVLRATHDGRPAALVFDVVATDGYAGPIALRIAVDRDGRVLGVRVTDHRETPGLGDGIEAARSGWIDGFRGRSLGAPPAARWRVRRDGGDFDQFAGATATPRAVVAAVARTLAFVATHGDALRAAEAGATLRFDDAPPTLPAPGADDGARR